jgi:hypothetical protein
VDWAVLLSATPRLRRSAETIDKIAAGDALRASYLKRKTEILGFTVCYSGSWLIDRTKERSPDAVKNGKPKTENRERTNAKREAFRALHPA